MIRFIIVSYPRCGSHMIATALMNYGGGIICNLEAFHRMPGAVKFGRGPEVTKRLYRDIWQQPRTSWNKEPETPPPSLDHPGPVAGGFIIQRTQGWPLPIKFRCDEFAPEVWDLIAEDDCKLIFLHRRNLLRRRVSEAVAERTQHWRTAATPIRPTIEPFHIRLTKDGGFYTDVESYWKLLDVAKTKLKHMDQIDVYYEDVIAEPTSEFARIQQFLGLEPIKDIRPRTQKQAVRPMRELVANYDQIVRTFTGTYMEEYLDDELEQGVSVD